MRTLIIRIEGEVEPGDLVILSAADRYRGGQTNARAHARPARDRIEVVNGHKTIVEDSPRLVEIVDMIVHEISSHWGAGFAAKKRNDNELVLQCETNSQDVNVFSSISGSMKQKVTIEDLA